MKHGKPPGEMRRRIMPAITGIAVAVAFMSALAFAGAPATRAQLADVVTAAPQPHWVRLCRQYQAVTEHTTWSALAVVRNDWWGQPGCITTNTAARDNFRVATSYRWLGPVQAYPETFRGCEYGRCTPNPGFPVRVSQLVRPAVRWMTRGPVASGSYNAALDLWFGRTSSYAGHADGAEVMIWPYRHGVCCSLRGARRVRVGGRWWWIEHWRACQRPAGACWNYVQFRAVYPVAGWRWLRLAPILAEAERIGALSRYGWWSSADAGFEIWSGGRGLASTDFWTRS